MKIIFRAALTGMLAAAAASLNPAHAGTCPAGQMRDGARASGETMPKGVTDNVLASIDLAKEPAAVSGRQLRLRRIVVQPGGVVPWHSHADRPAIITVVKGEVTEYPSNCAVGVVHKAGETVAEKAPIAHWWKNTGKVPAELLSADLLPADAGMNAM
jgi:quercetin dioxygenase-like cupin family protein